MVIVERSIWVAHSVRATRHGTCTPPSACEEVSGTMTMANQWLGLTYARMDMSLARGRICHCTIERSVLLVMNNFAM